MRFFTSYHSSFQVTHTNVTLIQNYHCTYITRKMVPITGRASSCLALSILSSSLAHLSSLLSCVFFFFSGSHPNSISYQVTNALSVSRGLLFLTTFFSSFFPFFFLIYLFHVLIVSLLSSVLQFLKLCLL